MRVHGTADRPQRARLPLDPDDDPLLVAGVVDPVDHPGDLHGGDYTIDSMLRFASFMRNPFAFLFAKTSAEEHVAAYLLREHATGRRVEDIKQDPYVQNRLTPEQQRRVLDRPDVVHALGEQAVSSARELLSSR